MKAKNVLIPIGASIAFVAVLYFLSLDTPVKAAKVNQAVADYKQFESLLQADEIDFQQVADLYHGALATIIESVDSRYDERLNSKIEDAISRAGSGTIPKIAAQIADKTISRGFYLFVIMNLDRLKKNPSSPKKILASAKAAYGALIKDAQDAGQWLGVNNDLDRRISDLFDQLEKSGKNKDSETLLLDKIESTLKGVMIAEVLMDIDQIDAYAHTDKMKALQYMASAKMRYYAFYEDQAMQDREGAILVINEFVKQPAKIDTIMIRNAMKTYFTGIIPELSADRFVSAGMKNETGLIPEPDYVVEIEKKESIDF